MSEALELRVIVASRPENVAVLRRAISGIGEAVGLEDSSVGDLQTIITEAAMNVVVHAYEEGEGPLELTASRTGDSLEVAIRDRGAGFRPWPADPERGDLRLGLPLIAALSDGFEIRGGPGQGTEVRARKRIIAVQNGDARDDVAESPGDAALLSFDGEAAVGPVVSRVIGMLASRADLSIDRLADTQLLGDAVSATPPGEFAAGRMDIEIRDREGSLEIRVGPLVAGAANRLLKEMELPDALGGSLGKLASRIEVEPAGDGTERLLIEVDDPYQRPAAGS
ncbi:MAG: ATP-binding protein [Solirubrobacterales bacterium]